MSADETTPQTRGDRAPATLFLRDGRQAELLDLSPREAAMLVDLARATGTLIGNELDPFDVEDVGYIEDDPVEAPTA